MLDIDGLTVSYGTGAIAVNELSLTVGDGECVALVGANGAGKSSTLRAITGLERPAAGRIHIDGVDVSGQPPHRVVTSGVVMVPEGRQLFPHLPVADNLILGAFSHRRKGGAYLRERIDAVVDVFPDLRPRLRSLAGSLSGGQQQMVAIGRALMGEPRLLILDEPSLGLAPLVCDTIFETIRRLHVDGMSVLLVEQNVRLSLEISERAYVLERGRIVLSGQSADLIDDPAVQEHYLGVGGATVADSAAPTLEVSRSTLRTLLARGSSR